MSALDRHIFFLLPPAFPYSPVHPPDSYTNCCTKSMPHYFYEWVRIAVSFEKRFFTTTMVADIADTQISGNLYYQSNDNRFLV